MARDACGTHLDRAAEDKLALFSIVVAHPVGALCYATPPMALGCKTIGPVCLSTRGTPRGGGGGPRAMIFTQMQACLVPGSRVGQ